MASGEFIKKAHQEVEMTVQQALELHKCALDPVYFIKNYCYIQNQKLGKMKFNLRPYQERIIRSLHQNRFNILMIGRQCGKCFLDTTLINTCKKPTGTKKFLLKILFPDTYKKMYDKDL